MLYMNIPLNEIYLVKYLHPSGLISLKISDSNFLDLRSWLYSAQDIESDGKAIYRCIYKRTKEKK